MIVIHTYNSAYQSFIAFRDKQYPEKLSVMKFDGTKWAFLGSPGFSFQIVGNISIAIGPVHPLDASVDLTLPAGII